MGLLDFAKHSSDFSSQPHFEGVNFVAQSILPTRTGKFALYAFEDSKKVAHLALVRGDVKGASKVPTRVHSQCLTGDALGSQRCDCRDQLESSMKYLGRQKTGILLYMQQEGRGIGLANKIRAYSLQDHGADTVDANRKLGLADDARDYASAAGMLKFLGVGSILLLTNNPAKIEGMRKHGIIIEGRIPVKSVPNKNNSKYLKTKKEKMHHMLE